MLELRPNCEICNKDLLPDGEDAMICSFECTYCKDCADKTLKGTCPNCGGVLCQRPSRSQQLLKKFPSSTKRVLKS